MIFVIVLVPKVTDVYSTRKILNIIETGSISKLQVTFMFLDKKHFSSLLDLLISMTTERLSHLVVS